MQCSLINYCLVNNIFENFSKSFCTLKCFKLISNGLDILIVKIISGDQSDCALGTENCLSFPIVFQFWIIECVSFSIVHLLLYYFQLFHGWIISYSLSCKNNVAGPVHVWKDENSFISINENDTFPFMTKCYVLKKI